MQVVARQTILAVFAFDKLNHLKKMKFLSSLLVATMFFVGCSKNEKTVENSESKNGLLKEVKNVSNQLGIQIDSKKFKEIRMEKSDPVTIAKAMNYKKNKLTSYSQRTSTEASSLDTANAVSYIFVLADGQELVSVMIPYVSNANEYFNYLKSGNDEMGLDLETQYNSQNGTLSMRASGPFGGWWGCMKNFFGSDAGTFVNIMGVASGVGCVACGVVAGFTTGIMAIACIHG